MMKAVHFGAGNIGRGFIGSLLDQSGYTVVFVDVNGAVIDAINEKKKYQVVYASPEQENHWVTHIEGINSLTDSEKVIKAITEADLVTTAVGPTILPIIAKLLVQGLQKRIGKTDAPLNIMACENMIGGSSLLKTSVYESLSEEEKSAFDQAYGFPNAAVDRIVPNQSHENDLLRVEVEPFYEWVVEEKGLKGKPDVKGIHFVPDLEPYIERKLFTVNTGHAIAAYLGYQAGLPTIASSMDHVPIHDQVENALAETGRLLVDKHGFDPAVHSAYVQKILQRFVNPNLEDQPVRVGRSPLRKLGPHDRLIGPAVEYQERFGDVPEFLLSGIVAALKFDYKEDEEAVKLQTMLQEKGLGTTLEEVSGLNPDSPLYQAIIDNLKG